MNTFVTPLGEFTLNRYPVQKDEQLRAWDAADEYLLSQLHEQQLLTKATNILILNDSFGALSISLASHNPISISDSYISQQAIKKNAECNQIAPEKITIQDSLQPLNNIFDAVLIKVPKNLAMLEDELFRIRENCNENTVILAGGMTKHIHTSTLQLFERIIGPTQSTLARKKSRLIVSEFDASLNSGKSPYPSEYMNDVTGDAYLNHANVFSREKLDIGSRFMLEHLPQSPHYQHILDLACGNGVLGIAAARKNPQAQVSFFDESFMAVASAKDNVQQLLINHDKTDSTRFEFKVTDCLHSIENNSLDLILNNPPFHQQHVVGDFVAWQMFKESKEKLRSGGELWIVGNRHLGYHIKLKRLFGNCQTIASNNKFVILKSLK
mgnify:CR=1 FL=1